jgi:hypothetical protein
LLALLPSALHIAPAARLRGFAFRITRTKDFSRLKINYSLHLAFWLGCVIGLFEAGQKSWFSISCASGCL